MRDEDIETKDLADMTIKKACCEVLELLFHPVGCYRFYKYFGEKDFNQSEKKFDDFFDRYFSSAIGAGMDIGKYIMYSMILDSALLYILK